MGKVALKTFSCYTRRNSISESLLSDPETIRNEFETKAKCKNQILPANVVTKASENLFSK